MTARTDHMTYWPDMDILDSTMLEEVLSYRDSFNNNAYTAENVRTAMRKQNLGVHDFMSLLSTAALPFLEEMAQKAKTATRRHFGNNIALFTPLYFANYCENYCIYCGFNSHNKIKRAKLSEEELHKDVNIFRKHICRMTTLLSTHCKT